jgi:hypothetical protein
VLRPSRCVEVAKLPNSILFCAYVNKLLLLLLLLLLRLMTSCTW